MRTRLLGLLVVVLAALALAACGATPGSSAAPGPKTMGQLSVAELKARLDAGESLFLLDVRTPQEFSQDGHVAQATLIPLDELSLRVGELPGDQPIACICRSGNRSSQACSDLAARGYDAINISGGMNAWGGAGYPVAH